MIVRLCAQNRVPVIPFGTGKRLTRLALTFG